MQKQTLSPNEEEALELLKNNIKGWLEDQFDIDKDSTSYQTLNGVQESVFEQYTGKEEIKPAKQRTLLLQALKEVVMEI